MVITIIVIISIERHWNTNVFSKRNLLYLYTCWDFVELSTQTLNAKSMLIFQILSNSIFLHSQESVLDALNFWYSLSTRLTSPLSCL